MLSHARENDEVHNPTEPSRSHPWSSSKCPSTACSPLPSTEPLGICGCVAAKAQFLEVYPMHGRSVPPLCHPIALLAHGTTCCWAGKENMGHKGLCTDGERLLQTAPLRIPAGFGWEPGKRRKPALLYPSPASALRTTAAAPLCLRCGGPRQDAIFGPVEPCQ